ncbi:MAG: carboxypeptidase-like regulatory domain-containing protein [Cyclobacteriaceae bacterium]|nr:carboxypeptidase-like regulatory domain-containing protein [Cyclobacteriaceae bacterium]
MLIRKFLLFTGIFASLCLSAASQEISFRGNIRDASTGEPIPYVSIAIADLYKGTSSNITGEFLIRADSLPVRLIFSHISYVKKEISVMNEEYLEVSLTPGEIMLDELVVEDKERGEYAYNLLLQALNVAQKHSRDWKYGLAYYRQVSQNADDYTELYEIFYDTRFSSKGIADWAIQEGRYAMETGPASLNHVFNKNFTLLSRLISMYQPETDKFIMPVNQNVRDLYDVSISGLKNIEGRKVAVVLYSPKEEINVAAMEGEILIDIASFEILKLHAFIRNDHFELIGLNNPIGSWKNYVLEIETAFKPVDEDLLPDYTRLTQTFDYYVDNEFRHPVKTTFFLSWYEYYQPEKFKRLGGRLVRYGRRDRDVLDRIGYNRRFWEDNPVVLRTPVEVEIVNSFESRNAFGSIYLNDREQVALDKDDLDNDPFIQQIKVDLRKSKLATSGEKVYLHTDKPFYATGETIWFNAFLVNLATHIPLEFSGVLYVDLLSPDGEILQNKRYDVRNGYTHGNIDLEKALPSGKYRIRAYTNWMKNYDPDFFYARELDLYNAEQVLNSKAVKPEESKDFDVQFLPEGGNLINGIISQVAFKAVDQTGKGIDISGKIMNESGGQVAELKTRHDGMGSVFYLPLAGVEFSAVVKYRGREKTFKMPEPLASGYALTVNNLKEKSLQIMVKSSPDLDDSEFYLVGHTRGIIYHREKGMINSGNAMIDIPKPKIPAGIFHLTLFDARHAPRCERLVFISNDAGILVNKKTDHEVLKPREKINIQLELTDHFDREIRNTRFSVAVTNAGHFKKQPDGENIMTYLLLTSDLKGHIENPGFYFQNDERDTQIAMDMLMLTQGWRRFTWKEIFDGNLSDTPYSHETGINLTGQAYVEATRSPLKNSYINFMSISDDFPGYWSAVTDQEGSFGLKNLEIPDTLSVVTISVDDKGNPVNIDIEINPLEIFPAEKKASRSYTPPVNSGILHYLNRFEERTSIEDSYTFSDRVVLEEIEVRSSRYETKIYGEPDAVIEMDDQLRTYTDIYQIIQGRIPGVLVSGQGMNASIRIRGISSFSSNTDPLVVIDGMPVSNITSTAMNASDSISGGNQGPDVSNVNSILLSLSPMDVERIEILKSAASASAYGVRGANGVIAIYTRRGPATVSNARTKGYEGLILPGYSYVREFYSPAYDVPREEHVVPDKRTTLYWNPSVKTNNLGKAEIEFFNSDEARILEVEIQGVTDFGDIINAAFPVGRE